MVMTRLARPSCRIGPQPLQITGMQVSVEERGRYTPLV
jgi:hypothetical protein